MWNKAIGEAGTPSHRIIFALLLFIGAATIESNAQQAPNAPTSDPILRINTTEHTAPIRQIVTDRENRYLVTASDDKTARVWSLPDNKLLTVLRVPIGDGNQGKLYAVALTPDSSTVALGGWTSASGTKEAIYLFDRASGALQKRISGVLPNTIDHLAYSADGKLLVAALSGPNGIRVFNAAQDYEPVASDSNYGDSSRWADFDGSGRLVTVSYDGFIRLYAANRYDTPIFKVKGRGGKLPESAVFSPDRQRVAVGYQDTTAVDLLSGSDLRSIAAADTRSVIGNNRQTTAWSVDGRYLFAGGRGTGTEPRVRRWENAGTGQYVDIPAGRNTIVGLPPLKSGGTVFSSTDELGIIDEKTRVNLLQGAGKLDFRNRAGTLKISGDGQTVEIGTEYPTHTLRFALRARRLDIDPPPDPALSEPITEAPNVGVTGWRNGFHPQVNGRPIALYDREMSRRLAIFHQGDGFLLGTDWHLWRFDSAAKPSWPMPIAVPGPVWNVNVTPSRQLIISAHGDGTIRWWRATDGQELLALFVHPDGKRWIAWTPLGYFDASVGADELIGWHVNHGFDKKPDFFPVSLFRKRFYRPDVVTRVLDTLDVEAAVKQADEVAGRQTAKAIPITNLLPPVVEIAEPAQKATVTEKELKVTYAARTRPDDPITRVEVQIDGRKAEGAERVLSSGNEARVGIISVTLPRRDAVVSVIAYDKNGPSAPASVQLIWAGRGSEPKPKLYLLAIGVGEYKDENLNLRYPGKDATDFITTVKQHAAGLYEDVITAPKPKDGRWTHDAVLDGLDWIKKAPTNKDVAIVFISGHGAVTADQVYRFLPYDYDSSRVERTTVRSLDFQDFLSKIGGKVLVFLDTCYSGDVFHGGKAPLHPGLDKFANELAAAENGAVVFASSTGNQLSWEDPAWGNGAFTKALVEGLDGKADARNVGVVRVSALADYVYDRVKELTEGKQKPMVANLKMVENFPIVAIAK